MTTVRPALLWRPPPHGTLTFGSVEGALSGLLLWAREPGTTAADLDAAMRHPTNAPLVEAARACWRDEMAKVREAKPAPGVGTHAAGMATTTARRMRAG